MQTQEIYGLALISIGNVMAKDNVNVVDAWTNHKPEHNAFLRKHNVPLEAIEDILECDSRYLLTMIQASAEPA